MRIFRRIFGSKPDEAKPCLHSHTTWQVDEGDDGSIELLLLCLDRCGVKTLARHRHQPGIYDPDAPR